MKEFMSIKKTENFGLSFSEKIANIPGWIKWFYVESKKFLNYQTLPFSEKAWFWVRLPFKTIGFIKNMFKDT